MSFQATEEVLRALTPENRRLIALIHRHGPASIGELCMLADRPQPNVSRALSTLEKVGIVTFSGERPKRPQLSATTVEIDLGRFPADPI